MSGEKDRLQFSHKVYRNDPVLFKSYVNKKVSVRTEDGNVHTGVVYTVDPVSESVVLVQLQDDATFKMKIIIGHSVKDIEVSAESETVITELFQSPKTKIPESVVAMRKIAIKDVLLKNRFPVTETEGVLEIEGMVSIEPPYGPEHCISNNEIILDRIQKLISSAIE